jgi:serine/threonine-protein kinase
MLRPGERVGRYVIEDALGEGGMGVVYRAVDTNLNRRVALKVVRSDAPPASGKSPSGGLRTDAKARLLAEARATAALDHPNAIAVYDVGEHEGAPFIAMELVIGKTLRVFIGDPAIPPGRRIRWLTEVARALAAAHKAGLVHRDIKPENVMVRDDGAIKVLDFGIARRTAIPAAGGVAGSPEVAAIPADVITTLTAGNFMVGTPLYLTPEQIRGDAVDARTDQFAWGVLAYELLMGKVPWQRLQDRMALLASILTDEAPHVSAPGVPPEVAGVIERALRKAPSQRFQSMDEILAILEQLAHEGPVSGPASGFPIRMPPPSQPALVAGPPPGEVARGEARAPELPRKRGKAALWIGSGILVVLGGAGVFAVWTLASEAPAPSVSASASAGPSLPKTNTPEALAAYQAAMQALRDGNIDAHEAGLLEAVRLDPAFPKAELRLAQAMLLSSRWTLADARQHIQKAARLRSLMPEQDQMYLGALEAAVSRDPPDIVEHEKRMREVVARYPEDVDLMAPLGMSQLMLGRSADAMATFDRVLALDPKFMPVWQMKAQIERRKGDIEAARRTLTMCMERLPGATGCRSERMSLDQVDGRCEAVEEDARQMVAADSNSYRPYIAMAGAAVSRGLPMETAAELLKQAWARVPPEVRAREELITSANLAVTAGDFNKARELGRKYAIENAASGTVEVHAQGARLLVSAALEVGDMAGAAKTARELLNRQAAWSAYLRPMNDVTPLMLRVERTAGKKSDAELEAARAEWVDKWQKRLPAKTDPGLRMQVWFSGFAAPASTRADAEAALAALPSYGTLPASITASADPRFDEAVGRVMLLAGRTDEAIEPLRRASKMCAALDYPFVQGRAKLLLGQALEEKGDLEGACLMYGDVIRWWGNATPRSASGEKAKERAKKLGCEAEKK